MNIQETLQAQEVNGERFGKYLIQKRVSKTGRPAITIYNLNCKRFYNSIVENWQFQDEKQREYFIEEFKVKVNRREAYKAEKKAKKATFVNELKVGDILCDTWGYDQTNVEFYKVLSVKGSTIEIRELAHVTVPGSEGFMSCSVLPSESFIQTAPILKKIVRSEYVKIDDCVSLSKWDGQKVYKSWYA